MTTVKEKDRTDPKTRKGRRNIAWTEWQRFALEAGRTGDMNLTETERAVERQIKTHKDFLEEPEWEGEQPSVPREQIDTILILVGKQWNRGKAERRKESQSLKISEAKPLQVPAPYDCDDEDIPARPWLYGRIYLKGVATATIAPGATGKSALTVAESLAMASGRNILQDSDGPANPMNVWLINLEEGQDELRRRFAAARQYHKISAEDIGDRLRFSGNETRLVLATAGHDGVKIAEPLVEQIRDAIEKHEIDVLIVDPFVSSHAVNENDNSAIDKVAKTWAAIAAETGCAVHLVHHARKAPAGHAGQDITVEDSRGAKALTDAVRAARVLNRMSKRECETLGLEHPWRYIKVDDAKPNYGPPNSEARWLHHANVSLPNGDGVGVVEAWQHPGKASAAAVAVAGLSGSQVLEIQQAIASGDWLESSRAGERWAGKCIAGILGIDLSAPAGKPEATKILAGLLSADLLRIESRQERDTSRDRHVKNFLTIGKAFVATDFASRDFEDGEDDDSGDSI